MAGSPDQVILVVEDDALARMLVHEALSSAGFHVIEAANVTEASTLLRARPDVLAVVADVGMPGPMNRFSLAWEIGTHWPNTPVILSSGLAPPSPGVVPEGTAFLQKPYPLSALVAQVRERIDSARPPAHRANDNVIPFGRGSRSSRFETGDK